MININEEFESEKKRKERKGNSDAGRRKKP